MGILSFNLRNAFCIVREKSGQDLIEYALVASVLAFAAIAGMNSVAVGVNAAFVTLATTFTSST